MKLKLFSDRAYLPPDCQPAAMLYPLWSDLHDSQLEGWISAYDRYVEVGVNWFEFTDLATADLAVLPLDWRSIRGDSWRNPIHWEARQRAIAFAEQVQAAGKPLAVFFGSECSDETLPISAQLVFRQSAYRSVNRAQTDFVFPFFCEDFVAHFLGGTLSLRQKQPQPVVGFCGLASPLSFKRRLQTPLYHAFMVATQGRVGVSPYHGESLRLAGLNYLAQQPGLATNFVIRDRAIFFVAATPEQKRQVRLEYVQNIVDSDYVFCCRGSGNYSHRLYEVLSCGRIPVFVNTDCKLPWEDQIDWRKYCVWVEERDLPRIGEKVLAFHQQLSADAFVQLQKDCRQLWQEWLSAEGFFHQLHSRIEAYSGGKYDRIKAAN
jgi:hypothetical protein